MNKPTLTGFSTSITVDENAVNATPQLLDRSLTFRDSGFGFSEGRLTVSGLLDEDIVSVRDQGDDTSPITVRGTDIIFFETVVGTLSGGAGEDLVITFNAATDTSAFEAMLENLTYANTSDTPTPTRDLVINVIDSEGKSLAPNTIETQFSAWTGDDLLSGMGITGRGGNGIGVVDLDGDGDLDLVISRFGTLQTFRNGDDQTSGTFTPIGASSPVTSILGQLDFAVDTSFVDLDGDGDLDLVVGENDGRLVSFRNGTDGTSGAFTAFGAGDPLAGVNVGSIAISAFLDLDNDGDLDVVVGRSNGTLISFRNGTDGTSGSFTAFGADDPFAGISVGTNSSPESVDLDGDGDLDLVVGNRDGLFTSFRNDGAGTASSFTSFGADNPFDGIDVGFFSNIAFVDLDNDGDLDGLVSRGLADAEPYLLLENTTPAEGTAITVKVVAQSDEPVLSNVADTLTFAENTVNVTPAFLLENADLFADRMLGGGALTIKDVLAEDLIEVRNQGTGVGEIGVQGTNVTFEGYVFATITGGNGQDLSIVFNSNSSLKSVEALIQNLTYSNISDDPTATRDFVINVKDASGAELGHLPGDKTFAALTDSTPLSGVQVPYASSSTFVDLDRDGDLDLVVGRDFGGLVTFRNGTDGTSGNFTAWGAGDPFAGLNLGSDLTPTFFDMDGDGDLDAVVGNSSGELITVRNGTTDTAGAFSIATADPLRLISLGTFSSPFFLDLDGDGDLDLVSSRFGGTFTAFRNIGEGLDAGFELFGVDDPFAGIDTTSIIRPAFADLDGDGDLDLVVGENDGTLVTYRNGTDGTSGNFTAWGVDDPFAGLTVSAKATPTFYDVDYDGDLDLVVGNSDGTLNVFENTTQSGIVQTVNITSEADDTVGVIDLPSNLTFTEDAASDVDLTLIRLTGVDLGTLTTLTLTASEGTLEAIDASGVTASGVGTDTLVLMGLIEDLRVYLGTASNIQYTSALHDFGLNAASLTVTASDGVGTDLLGTIALDITGVGDGPAVLTDWEGSVTFEPGDVQTTPQLLDAYVTLVDVDISFAGGKLSIRGLLPEDIVSVRDQGTGAGEVGLNGADVSFGGVVIGTLTGGDGAELFIAFNQEATTQAVEAVVENLTYANTSSTPTASRDLAINITNAAGLSLVEELQYQPWPSGPISGANPFSGFRTAGIYVGTADLDGDGDLDLLTNGKLLRNGTDGTAGGFTPWTTDVPFDSVTLLQTTQTAFAFADLDGDGDPDLVTFDNFATRKVTVLRNGTEYDSGQFVPWDGLDLFGTFDGNLNTREVPIFTDLDGDGDLDFIIESRGVSGLGQLNVLEAISTPRQTLTVNLNVPDLPVSDTDPTAVGVPVEVTVVEDTASNLDLSSIVLSNAQPTALITLTLSASSGTMAAANGAGVLISGSGTDALVLIGVASAIDAYLNDPASIQYTGAEDVSGYASGFVFLTANDGTGQVSLGAVSLNITPENDAPTATGIPSDVQVVEDTASNLDLSEITLSDPDTSGPITLTLTADAGAISATDAGGVTVTGSGTSVLTLTGPVGAIDAFLNDVTHIQYTGVLNASGNDAAEISLTADDGSGPVTLGTVNVDIRAVFDGSPVLSDLESGVTFAENTVNAMPQLLDADVSFTVFDTDFDGGKLTVSGVLAEDTVSVRDQGTGASEIGLSGAQVSFGGVVIGTLTGGAGADLEITFNADASAPAIEALIENLTYANSSDTPTTTRDLLINVADASGADLTTDPVFVDWTGFNPVAGVNVGDNSAPAFIDLDGDGDQDLVVGAADGTLHTFRNGSNGTAGTFEAWAGTDPFAGIAVGTQSSPAFADLDGDGDLDLVVGNGSGPLETFRNGTDTASGAFTEWSVNNPFTGLSTIGQSRPSFVDLDVDGDLDLVVGGGGLPLVFVNGDNGSSGAFTEVPGITVTPTTSGITQPSLSFIDLDGDGDKDLVRGDSGGRLTILRNGTDGTSGDFAPFGGFSDRPFFSIYAGTFQKPSFVDLDGDGDLDAVIGNQSGTLLAVENTSQRGQTIAVTVTEEADGPTVPVTTGIPSDVVVVESTASDVDLSGITLTDPGTIGPISLTLSADIGVLSAIPALGVTVTGSGTAELVVTGTVGAIDAFLNGATNIQYIGVPGVTGDDAATLSITADGGSGPVTLGSINLDITPVNVAPTASGIPTDVTVAQDVLSDLDLSALTLTDVDSVGPITVTLTASAGVLEAVGSADLSVSGNGSGTLTLTGTVAVINAYLDDLSNVQYAGPTGVFGDDAATISIAANDGFGSVSLGTVNVDITKTPIVPTLTVAIADAVVSEGDGATASTVTVTRNTDVTNELEVTLASDDTSEATVPTSVTILAGQSSATVDLTVEDDAVVDGTQSAVISASAVGFVSGSKAIDVLDNDVRTLSLVLGDLSVTEGDGFSATTVTVVRNSDLVSALEVMLLVDDASEVIVPVTATILAGESSATVDLAVIDDVLRDGVQSVTISASAAGYTSGSAVLDVLDNDAAPGGSGLVSDVVVTEDLASDFDLSGFVLSDVDTFGAITLTLNASGGTLSSVSTGDVSVGGNGTGVLTLTGTAAAITGHLSVASGVQYTGARDAFGDNAATVSLSADDGVGPVALGVVNVDITPVNDAPVVTGLSTDLSVAEDLRSPLDLSSIALSDVDVTDPMTLFMSVSAGVLGFEVPVPIVGPGVGPGVGPFSTAPDPVVLPDAVILVDGVTIIGAGTAELTLSGLAADIDALLNARDAFYYTSALNAFGDDAATLDLRVEDGTVSVPLGSINLDIVERVDTQIGTPLAETLTGDAGRDVLSGLGENDTLTGNAGGDTLEGGDGADLFTFVDGDGADVVQDFEYTRDAIQLNGANIDPNALPAGASIAQIGVDVKLDYTGGTVLLRGVNLSDWQWTLLAAVADGVVHGTTKADLIDLGFTDPGGDSFDGTGQVIAAGKGSDTIIASAGEDTVDGGSGFDTVDYSAATGAIKINMNEDGYGGIADKDVYISVEAIIGTDFDDILLSSWTEAVALTGGAGNDFLRGADVDGGALLGGMGDDSLTARNGDTFMDGGAGLDALNGGNGDDTMLGSEGADRFDGSKGYDTVDYSAATGAIKINMNEDGYGGIADKDVYISIEEIIGTGFDDILLSSWTSATTVFGGVGDDFLRGSDVDGAVLYGEAGNDTLQARNGDTVLDGGLGDDVLKGVNGDDALFGQDGDDWMQGGKGKDTLDGGLGVDTALGGAGDDIAILTNQDATSGEEIYAGFFDGGAGVDDLQLVDTVSDYRVFLQDDTFLFRHQGLSDASGLGRVIATAENIETFNGVDLSSLWIEVLPDAPATASFEVPTLSVDDAFAARAKHAQAAAPTDISAIRDFDGNALGAASDWKLIGQADTQADGDIEFIYINAEIGRWATVGPDGNGQVDFGDHGTGGDTRVVGIYIDPLVAGGEVEKGSDFDSQQRFANDLAIDNLTVLDAFDFDGDGFQEVYFKVNDGTAYLRALMHADGNIQYANYQNAQQVEDYLTNLGYGQNVLETILG